MTEDAYLVRFTFDAWLVGNFSDMDKIKDRGEFHYGSRPSHVKVLDVSDPECIND